MFFLFISIVDRKEDLRGMNQFYLVRPVVGGRQFLWENTQATCTDPWKGSHEDEFMVQLSMNDDTVNFARVPCDAHTASTFVPFQQRVKMFFGKVEVDIV
jgi:hypothetical protein